MKIIKQKSMKLQFSNLYAEGYDSHSPSILNEKENNTASAIRALSKNAQITDEQFETFTTKYGITLSYYLLCLLDINSCVHYSKKKYSEYLLNNYPEKLQTEMFLFFTKVFFPTDNVDKVEFIINNNGIVYITAIIKYEIQDSLEFEGIKIQEFKDNLIYERELENKEKMVREELIKEFEKKEQKLLAEFEKKENLLIEKEGKLLAGFQTKFNGLQYRNLNDLQSAKFISDYEKRIICGLLPMPIHKINN
jgi:hypothetical protein